MSFYCDTSALVKVVVEEADSTAFAAWLTHAPRSLYSSDLTRTELMRAVRRHAPAFGARARSLLGTVALVQLTSPLLERAALLDPPELRTLDAIHLATALSLGGELDSLVTYDERLARAARESGIPTLAPS